MAIKWKNNKYKGILAVLLCVSLAGVIMCNLYPVFWQKAQKRIQTYQTEEEARVSKNRDVAAFTVGDDFERYHHIHNGKVDFLPVNNFQPFDSIRSFEYFIALTFQINLDSVPNLFVVLDD